MLQSPLETLQERHAPGAPESRCFTAIAGTDAGPAATRPLRVTPAGPHAPRSEEAALTRLPRHGQLMPVVGGAGPC